MYLKSKVKMVEKTPVTLMPTTWNYDKKIASHGELMKLGSTPVEVKYGAYGRKGGFVYKKVSGNVKCDTQLFEVKEASFDGDPAWGRNKNCFVSANAPSGKKIATHGQMMNLGSTPVEVKYGAFGKGRYGSKENSHLSSGFVYKKLSGNVECSPTAFREQNPVNGDTFLGDPAPGRHKHCYVAENKADSQRKANPDSQRKAKADSQRKAKPEVIVGAIFGVLIASAIVYIIYMVKSSKAKKKK